MLICVDIDGTIDADPAVMGHILQALHAAGDEIVILTGHHAGPVDQAAVQAKQDYLAELGITCYLQLVVFPDDGNVAEQKAAWIRAHGASLLIDNNRGNAQAAMNDCLVLVPWATRLGKK